MILERWRVESAALFVHLVFFLSMRAIAALAVGILLWIKRPVKPSSNKGYDESGSDAHAARPKQREPEELVIVTHVLRVPSAHRQRCPNPENASQQRNVEGDIMGE